jgi:hypothetical protein
MPSPQRWGDAPVHSIAASLFARKDQIHFFSDIGYRHSPFQHCPQGNDWSKGKCACDPSDSFGLCIFGASRSNVLNTPFEQITERILVYEDTTISSEGLYFCCVQHTCAGIFIIFYMSG